jgi:MFS family permease
MTAVNQLPSDLAHRTRRRITRRLLPFLFVLYIISYLDRVNLGYAALDMTRELGFSNAVFGAGAGIFFIGYFLLEIPATILVEVWSARKWIARIMITWGVVASLTGLVTNAHQLYTVRFFLGLAEAGFFPGIIVYLTHWFARDRQGDRNVHDRDPSSQVIGRAGVRPDEGAMGYGRRWPPSWKAFRQLFSAS